MSSRPTRAVARAVSWSGCRAAATCLTLAAAALLGGCSAGQPARAKATEAAADLGLTGPWARDFAEAITGSRSAYEKEILQDGDVDASEVADAQAHVQRCLGDSGYRIDYYQDGGFEVDKLHGGHASDDMTMTNRVLESCEAKYDQYVTFMYEQTRRNPHKQDEAEISAACLRASGLVGRDYTERRWREDNDTGDWPYDDYDPRAVQCRLDPLGLWRQQ